MTLNPHATYPNNRTYVLKLHRDALPVLGKLFGRLENLSSGQQFDFATAEELLGYLAQDATCVDPRRT
jgi:sortase (surface protein transpeptidase)